MRIEIDHPFVDEEVQRRAFPIIDRIFGKVTDKNEHNIIFSLFSLFFILGEYRNRQVISEMSQKDFDRRATGISKLIYNTIGKMDHNKL